MKTTGGVVTKYVYGLGLIGEESGGAFKTYHFDNRGSTVAITDANGNVIDAFRYDTYGRMTEHVGSSDVIFGYNGRDGVVTDKNGLIYMRARYYSPKLRRFVNADVIAGRISNAITLNRYAYANGNPVSNIDPFGLEGFLSDVWSGICEFGKNTWNAICEFGQDVFKKIETGALKVESNLNKLSVTEYIDYFSRHKHLISVYDWKMAIDFLIYMGVSKRDFENYAYNLGIEIPNDYIDDQDAEPYSNFKLGKQTMSFNGCEVIAVYNAMRMANYNPSLADLAFIFEITGTVIADNLIGGYFGSNPYSLPRVFDIFGLSYDQVSFNQLSVDGTYIISYWTGKGPDAMVHTVAIQKQGDNYHVYNDYYKDLSDLSVFKDGFITGYRIYDHHRK